MTRVFLFDIITKETFNKLNMLTCIYLLIDTTGLFYFEVSHYVKRVMQTAFKTSQYWRHLDYFNRRLII